MELNPTHKIYIITGERIGEAEEKLKGLEEKKQTLFSIVGFDSAQPTSSQKEIM